MDGLVSQRDFLIRLCSLVRGLVEMNQALFQLRRTPSRPRTSIDISGDRLLCCRISSPSFSNCVSRDSYAALIVVSQIDDILFLDFLIQAEQVISYGGNEEEYDEDDGERNDGY